MRTKTITIALSGIIGLSAMTTTQAGLREAFIMNQVMAKIDNNRNGQLDLPELQARWNKSFNTHDKGYDKQLSYAEFAAMLQSQQAKLSRFNNKPNKLSPAKMFTALDKDKNRFISHQEYINQRVNIFRRMDVNKDNSLSKSELRALKGKLQNLQ